MMVEKLLGVGMMVGALVFAFLYDTGRWPAVWSVIEHGVLPANFGQNAAALSGAPTASNPAGSFPGVTLPGGTILPGPAYPSGGSSGDSSTGPD
jgi:hypothetical protein